MEFAETQFSPDPIDPSPDQNNSAAEYAVQLLLNPKPDYFTLLEDLITNTSAKRNGILFTLKYHAYLDNPDNPFQRDLNYPTVNLYVPTDSFTDLWPLMALADRLLTQIHSETTNNDACHVGLTYQLAHHNPHFLPPGYTEYDLHIVATILDYLS